MNCQPERNGSQFNFHFSPDFIATYKWYQDAERVIDNYVTNYICLFGIFGNLINFVVLSRKSLTAHMERMEKASHVGLIALAVSDFLYCLCSYPQAYQPNSSKSESIDFWRVYATYGFACINCFLLTSTWLTVSMAVCRYLAICHPLRARQYLGMTASRAIIIAVFCLSILFNLPRFWMKKIVCRDQADGSWGCRTVGYLEDNKVVEVTYMWLYFTFGILLPLVVLAYCNLFLVKALHESRHLRRQHSASSQSNDSTRIVTLTLCVIVVMYIVLVGPAELVTFWTPFVDCNNVLQHGLAVRICNCMQMFNFAVNFILYCIINVHFRRVVRDLLLCQHLREQMASHSHHSRVEQSRNNGQEAVAML